VKRWLVALIPVVLIGAPVAWRLYERQAQSAAEAAQRSARAGFAPTVSLAPVEVRDITRIFKATGSVEAPLNVEIASKVTGRIEYLQVREGDRVRKGQVLVRIDPSEIEANVQQQQANLAEAQYRLAQAQLNQSPTNVAVNTQIRQQKASVLSATADLNQVRENSKAQLAAANAGVRDAESKVANARAAVQSAQANLDNATAKYNRILDLYKQGFTAAQDVDDAKAAMKVQQSALDIAQGQLKSAIAQKEAAEQQASIVKTKGDADIAAARAKLDQAKAALEYANANSVQKPAYEQSLSALRASVDAARAALKMAQAKRADTVLTAPLDGVVTARYADPGAMATPGQPIIAVQFTKQIWVTIAVPEEISPKLHIGQPAKVTVDALPDRVFMGSIIQVNGAADPESRQLMARVILDNKEGLFKPGMYARVSIETDRVKSAISVPREAVQRDTAGPFVMVVDAANKAMRRDVVLGAESPDRIAIEEGVRPGEKVVTMSASPVRDGQEVRTGGPGGPGGPGGGPGGPGGPGGKGGSRR